MPSKKPSVSKVIRPTLWDALPTNTQKNLYCERNTLTNEASVETFFASRLLADLGYSDAQIKTKESIDTLIVAQGHKKQSYKPDYVLFFGGQPRVVVDAKAPDQNLEDWVPQCSGYCLALNQSFADADPVQHFILTNGLYTSVYRWNHSKPLLTLEFFDFDYGCPKYEQLRALLSPQATGKASKGSNPAKAPEFALTRPSAERARSLFAQCHQVIWKSDVFGPAPAFMEFVKVMFVKLWEDKKLRDNPATKGLFATHDATVKVPASTVIFSVDWVEQREKEGARNPVDSILFSRLRDDIEEQISSRQKKRLFDNGEHIRLRSDTVKEIVRRLQHVDMFGIDEDLNGRLFETFLSATMRGRELGQFFTPRSIVKVMTRLADLQATPGKQSKVIDACCGSGGFLIEALTMMRNTVRENASLNDTQKRELIETICNRCFYGVDYGKDPPLARIARINMYLHGDGGSRIYYADGLDKGLLSEGEKEAEIILDIKELRDAVDAGLQFDVALTNPPFSMTKELRNESEGRILKAYRLAKRPGKTGEIRPALRSSLMFIERYHDLLKPGGKLITVIDDTLLASKNFAFFRDFIRENFLVRGIVSLPGDAFRRQGSRVKTSVLILEKKQDPAEAQSACFTFFSQYLGVDDLTPRASESDIQEARAQSFAEADRIVNGYQDYLNGKASVNVLPAKHFTGRLDLKFCVPLFGRFAPIWKSRGIEVRELRDLVTVEEDRVNPSGEPDTIFQLLSVSYGGRCVVEDHKPGRAIRHTTMLRVQEGDIVFSKIRATDGAIGIVPKSMDGAVVSASSFVVLDAGSPEDSAYLWSVLRSHELRADMQSLSPGSSRYNTPWPEVGKVLVPWLDEDKRTAAGKAWMDAWELEEEVECQRLRAQVANYELGIESEDSIARWTAAKAPT